MLDIYSITDQKSLLGEPSEERYLGSLSLEDHAALATLWASLAEERIYFSYFEDSRIDSKLVLVAIEQMDRIAATGRMSSHPPFEKFRRVLSKAAERGEGIVTFGD